MFDYFIEDIGAVSSSTYMSLFRTLFIASLIRERHFGKKLFNENSVVSSSSVPKLTIRVDFMALSYYHETTPL